MDRERRSDRPGAATQQAPEAAAPGRSTLVEDNAEPEARAIPRLELRPSGAGGGLRGTTAGARPTASAQPQATAPQAPAGSQTAAPAAQHAGAAIVTHRTEYVAPDNGSHTRSTVGVGEHVHFTATMPGTWSADMSGPNASPRGTGTSFPWVAPSTPGIATITFTPSTPGHAPVPTRIKVIAPTTVDYRNGFRVPAEVERRGAASVNMHSRVVFGPNNVSFAHTTWSEDPGPPSNMRGYFRRWRPINHAPLNEDSPVDLQNHGPLDEAGYWSLPTSTYEEGEFEWVIPTNYGIYGHSERYHITDVHQRFKLEADGTMTVTKGSSQVTRRP